MRTLAKSRVLELKPLSLWMHLSTNKALPTNVCWPNTGVEPTDTIRERLRKAALKIHLWG